LATRKKQSGAGAAGLLTTTAQTIGSTLGKLAAKAKKKGVAKGRK